MSQRKLRSLVLAIGAVTVFGACGGGAGGNPTTAAKEHITVGGFNFSESSILANMYGKALQSRGYQVSFKLNLGNREVVAPALEKGDIDLYPGYAATELEFFNQKKGEASGDPQANVDKLNTYLKPKNLQALIPSKANDENAFAVTKATAQKYNLSKLSDLASVAGQLTLGGPPECPTRPYCALGLQNTYGIRFKDFKALDAGGPLTKGALEKGDIDVGLVFSSDGAVVAKNFVVLQDDKHLEAADNIVPLIRTKVANSEVVKTLNDIDAALTTDDLTAMNKSADIDKQDPDALASNWLKQHGFTK
jgi:osmoprotectant transport system substrate-binding protein